MQEWYLYMIRCKDGSLYTGIATDVQRRLQEHQGGKKGARYLRGRGPLHIVKSMKAGTRSSALKLESRVKKMSKKLKEELVSGQRNFESINNTQGLPIRMP
ncbi:MAG: GIY-YIG nuclease family protein [Nitrospira sp.]|nr:GIY-YIG nuclease family protein [bacterium]MBL7048090.1 GIY-YIG nuclease family protein [Nitrospira sp.]